ncbi:MAG: asparagine synthase (glutamine-hydrolyzing) [bacterium]|nr:asparagine synthase (glutamine-hydrolyzing) [bacterium]
MSGICGGYWLTGKPKTGLVKDMTKLISYRGPDDTGFYFDDRVVLGIARLAIIDLRKNLYPLHNETKSIHLILDGEIYNFNELKESLVKLGHNFYTSTDGEVILHLYEERGASLLKELNGNFSFALWDSNNNRLLLAIDRFGIKPLYYCVGPDKLLFASEIKALLEDESLSNSPNDALIYDFLVTGVHDHTDETFFAGINKLMPGEYVVIERGELKKNKYWKLEAVDSELKNAKSTIHRFFDLFEDSVRLRVTGEVKPGALLSGGLDSSSVVGMLNKFMSPITFSSCRSDPYLDERKYIEAVTKKLCLKSNYVFPKSSELWGELESLIWHQDEPIRGASTWDHFSVMKLAHKNGINVLFDGTGGDELLCGYTSYFPQFLFELIKGFNMVKFIKEFIFGFDLVSLAIKERLFGKQNPKEFLSKDFISKFDGREGQILLDLFPASLQAKSYYAVTKYSLVFLLKETGRNSSAFGIEARLPFLDHRLVEYVFSLPISYKMRDGWSKWLLRKSMRDILPESVLNRRRKVGFGTPEARWTRELSNEIESLFSSTKFKSRPYWDAERVLLNFKRFCKGKRMQPDFFWRVLSLEIWLRVFFS